MPSATSVDSCRSPYPLTPITWGLFQRGNVVARAPSCHGMPRFQDIGHGTNQFAPYRARRSILKARFSAPIPSLAASCAFVSITGVRHSRFSPRGSEVGKRVSFPYNGKEGPRSPHPPRGPLSTAAHRCAAPLDVAVIGDIPTPDSPVSLDVENYEVRLTHPES